MKRPALVTVAIVLQGVLGLLVAATAVYLIILSRSQQILSEPDAANAVHGLRIAAGVVSIPAAITLIAAFGLWKGRFWGWVLSLATDVGVVAVFVYNAVGENDAEGGEIATVVGFLALVVLLLLPVVRRYFWNSSGRVRSA